MKSGRHPSVLVNKRKQKQKNRQSKAKGQAYHFMIVFTDVDECSQRTHSCSAYAICTNTKGSYNCSCKALYTGDGRKCTRLGENPLTASRVGARSLNCDDHDGKNDCERNCNDADNDNNGVDTEA